MPLFRRGLADAEKIAARQLILHLQTMYAYQQLTMERYNDALARAGTRPSGNEFRHERAAGLSTAANVTALVIPALMEKQRIFDRMAEQHAAFGRPSLQKLQQPYDDFNPSLAQMRLRATAQLNGWIDWMADPLTTLVDTSAEDLAERKALDKSLASLNSLIEKVGLSPDDWLEIVCQAFNVVRTSLDLPPLTEGDFRARYFGGMASGSARFFAD